MHDPNDADYYQSEIFRVAAKSTLKVKKLNLVLKYIQLKAGKHTTKKS